MALYFFILPSIKDIFQGHVRLAVLTFIGCRRQTNKQTSKVNIYRYTNKQTDKQNKYIYKYIQTNKQTSKINIYRYMYRQTNRQAK